MNLEKLLDVIQEDFENNTDVDEKRKHGQFFTPISMAKEITEYGVSLLKDNPVRFLEPAFGMGSFYYAVRNAIQDRTLLSIGIEQDDIIYQKATDLWKTDNVQLLHEDFLSSTIQEKQINLLITNPPYVRHHLIDSSRKDELRKRVQKELGLEISGLAGLYCYFLLLSHRWLSLGAVSGWLIPSEFMDVNYGGCLKEYLLKQVRLVRIHRYNPADSQFDRALVSSSVVWFVNEKSEEDYEVEFTFGGSHQNPERRKFVKKSVLLTEDKWTRFPEKDVRINTNQKTLKDYFDIKRGIATGDNSFFIMTLDQIKARKLDLKMFVPVLPSPRLLKTDEIFPDKDKYPVLSPQLFLLKCDLTKDQVKKDYPNLWKYLKTGEDKTGNKYLCKNRKQWFWQENRKATPFLCSYMGRSKEGDGAPFRFILNHSNAIVTNTYLMLYPKEDIQIKIDKDPTLVYQIWTYLRNISSDDFESEGRISGGGLRKIEPKELGKVPCEALSRII